LIIVILITVIEIGSVGYATYYAEKAIEDVQGHYYEPDFDDCRDVLERELKCCGFDSYNETEKCGFDSYNVNSTLTCETKIKDIVETWENRFIAGGVSLFVIEILLVVFIAYLVCCSPGKPDEMTQFS
jgi:hypothetical protein